MIWFRRIVAIPFIILFFVSLISVLLFTQLNDTVMNTEFYSDQLKKGDVYNFIYDDVLPQVLEDIEEDESSDFPITLSEPVVKSEIATTAEKILPPDWIEEQADIAIDTFFPYFLGDTDEFTYTFVATDRIYRAVQILKEDFLQSAAFVRVYDDLLTYLADKLIENIDELPFYPDLSSEDVANSFKTAASQDWIVTQLEAALDSFTPYITGETEHFTITIPLEDRVDSLSAAFIELFSSEETYDYLLDELITPLIEENIDQIVDLPFEVTLTQEEVISVIQEVIPQWWMQEQLEALIDEIAAYAKSETDSIRIRIDISDRKAEAIVPLAGLADQKLEDLFYSLPTCSMMEFLQQINSLYSGSIPDCRPEGISYEDFKAATGLDLESIVEQEIMSEIPDQWIYTEEELRTSLGENADFLDDARTYVSDGWTFTDEDLLEQLDKDGEETLNEVREWIENGYTITNVDLSEAMEDGGININDADRARHTLHTMRSLMWLLWISPFMTLISISFLVGRKWWSRIAWGMSILFIAALVIFVAINPIYTAYGEPYVEKAVPDSTEYEGLDAIMVDKGDEMLDNSIDTYINGIKMNTIYMMIGSGVILLFIVGWIVLWPRYREGDISGRIDDDYRSYI